MTYQRKSQRQKLSKEAPAQPSHKGAVQSKTGIVEIFKSYWRHHRSSALDSFDRLLTAPGQTLMTSLVVAIALALPVTLLLALGNVSMLGKNWDSSPKISVYLDVRVKPEAVEKMIAQIEAFPEVESLEYLSQEKALADFQTFSGFGKALDALEHNPLPPTLIVTPRRNSLNPAQLSDVGRRIQALPNVIEVALDMDWIRRLQEIMLLGRQIVLVLACVLGAGVLLAIGNTIRLAIENRKDEILVTKLVGGTDGFVRRPFLYSGGWYGLFGGLLACVLVAIGFAVVSPSVGRLADLYLSDFELQGLGFVEALQLLCTSAALGWLGAWIAVGRHIRHIEPR